MYKPTSSPSKHNNWTSYIDLFVAVSSQMTLSNVIWGLKNLILASNQLK